MTQRNARKAAEAFLEDYADPEINKRLYFEVWADRARLSPMESRKIWQEVRRLGHKAAAEKRSQTWRLRRSQAAVRALGRAPVDGACEAAG